MRLLTIETGINKYAEGSALIRWGNTHVLCTASIEESVPKWLSGKEQGWVTAEYSMLPRSTHQRTKRDREKISGRTQEIQRLIGRALRSIIHLEKLGERSLLIDCDVLQADGGTRTASITGGCVALTLALHRLSQAGKIGPQICKDTVAAISVGLKGNEVLVDLDYPEDSSCDVDMNFVITGQGEFVEIQGTGERKTFSHADQTRMTEAALVSAQQIKQIQLDAIRKALA